MSEHQTPPSETERQKVDRLLNEVRVIIAESLEAEPLDDNAAQSLAQDFGVQAGGYRVFADTLGRFASGFARFVPIDDTGDTLDAIQFITVGGPMNNLNRSIHNVLISPNGDLTERIVKENDQGVTTDNFTVSASSDSDEGRAKYGRHISFLRNQAHSIQVGPAVKESEGLRAPDVQVAKPARGKFGRGIVGLLRRNR